MSAVKSGSKKALNSINDPQLFAIYNPRQKNIFGFAMFRDEADKF